MCGCNSGKTANGNKIEYQVRFKDGSTINYPSTQLANAAIREAGGGTMRAVAVKG